MKFFKKAYGYIGYHGFLAAAFYALKLLFLYCQRLFLPGGGVVRRVNARYKMRLNLRDDGISKALYLYGSREKDQVFIVRENVKSGMRVLDIGANIGYYVLLEADIVGSRGRVFAFEPNRDNFSLLETNVRMNNISDRVRLYRMGVSDRDGTMEFFISSKPNLHTLNPRDFKVRSRQPPFTDSVKIEVADIARLLKEERIDFMRMDIEGHEVDVLGRLYSGINDIEVLPSILLETHLSKYDDERHSMRKALINLCGRGYAIDTVISNNEPKGPLKKMGYSPERIIKTDQTERGIYRNIDRADALSCVCDTGGIRAILLTAKTQNR